MPAPIKSAKDIPLNLATGSIPNMEGALLGWFQPMVFAVVTKVIEGGEVVETMVSINFHGVIYPFTAQQLLLKPEGQRSWKWNTVCSETALELKPDDVIDYRGSQYRVMEKLDYGIYGFYVYNVIQDYTGSGPEETP